MESFRSLVLVLLLQTVYWTKPVSNSHINKREIREDLSTSLNVEELIPQHPSILDKLMKNGLFSAQIAKQLENALKNFTDLMMLSSNNSVPSTVTTTSSTVYYNVSNLTEYDLLEENFKKAYPLDLWKKHGWFDEGLLRMINPHWLKFPPTPKVAHYTLAFLYSIVAVCGFVGNIFVIFMFFKCQSLRTPANILIVNLAFSDFLMVSEIPIFIYNSVYLGPALGKTACTIYGFIGGITGTVSIGTLTAIAFDRYSVVVYPLEPLRSITRLRAKISVLIVWLYGGLFASIPALDVGLGNYVPEGLLTSCSFDYLSDDKNHKIFIFVFFCAAWVLPLSIISFCYINILNVVISTRSMGKSTGSISSRHCKEHEKRKTEMKLAGIVIAVIALFFIAWTPYAVVSLLGVTGYRHLLEPLTSMLPAIFCKIASCIDPFVYIVTHPKFRQECENLLLSKKEQRRRSTMRQGWSMTGRQLQPDITSEDDVEVVEMAKVPFSNDLKLKLQTLSDSPKRGIGLATVTPIQNHINTVSLRTHNKSSPVDSLPKSTEENKQLQPPTWFVKPQFVERGSSLKKVVKTLQKITSEDTLPT